MKARVLTKILNDTEYIVNNDRDYIAVGSPLCHNLINLDKKTLKVKYALDTWNEGRAALETNSNTELLFIWDKLHELIESGEIQDIINGDDVIENPLPVFYIEEGLLVESSTDEYGWPNTTIEGYIMYENTHFDNKEDAIKQGISEHEAFKRLLEEQIEEREKELKEKHKDLEWIKQVIADFSSMSY